MSIVAIATKAFWLLMFWITIASTGFAADNYLLNNAALKDGAFTPAVWYYEDKTEDATLEQVQTLFTQHGFHAAPKSFNAGISQPPHWFKVQLDIASTFDTQAHPQLYLNIGDPILDHVTVHHYTNGRKIRSIKMGASEKFASRSFTAPSFVIPITIHPGDNHTFWVKVNTSNSMHFPVTVLTPNEYTARNTANTMFYGSIFGMTIIMIAYNALMGWRVRSVVYLYYTGVLVGGLLHRSFVSGLGYQFFWPEHPEINYYLRPFTDNLLAFFSTIFTQKLLNTRQFSPLLHRWLTYLAIVSIISAASVFFISPKYSLNIALWILLIAFLFEYVIGIEFWLLGVKHSTLFLVGWFVFLTGSIILIFAVFGAIPLNGFTAHAAELGFAVHILALSFALSDQINYMQKEKLQAQEETARAQEELLSIQISLNEDLDRQVKQRTEELEQANARLSLLNYTDELTGLHNRRYINENLPIEFKRAHRNLEPISMLMLDIDHFKQLNDTFGHPFGDAVLQHTGAIFAAGIRRPPDIAARFGGEEFLIVLPGTDGEGAVIVAEKIRRILENTIIEHEAQSTSITVSIGVASEIPGKNSSYEALLRKADNALYQAKNKGRNRVVLAD